jgi:OOP family OmpA-OmpF porin
LILLDYLPLQPTFTKLQGVFSEFLLACTTLRLVHSQHGGKPGMNIRKLIGTGVACILTAQLSTGTSAHEGFYLGAGIGSAQLDDSFDGLDIDDDTTAYRLVAGWRLNRYVGLEAGWHDFGDFEQSFTIDGQRVDATLSADGYTLGLSGSYPLGNRLELMGRAGAFFWDGEAELTYLSEADPGDTNPYYGAGLGYALGEQFLVTGDWTRYELEDTRSDVFSVGFQFRF